MAGPVSRLAAVNSSDLEQYPIDRAERLDAHAFLKWQHHRWMSSRTFKLASWEAQGMIRALFDMAQSESPIGTLPDDDAELAVMLKIDARRMTDLRRMEFGPLRGWRRCLCGNEVRLMHPVVLEQVQDALDRRNARSMSTDEQAERKRLERLRKALKEQGLSPAIIADNVLIQRIDEWLAENWKKNRTSEAYAKAIMFAQKSRWFGG